MDATLPSADYDVSPSQSHDGLFERNASPTLHYSKRMGDISILFKKYGNFTLIVELLLAKGNISSRSQASPFAACSLRGNVIVIWYVSRHPDCVLRHMEGMLASTICLKSP